MNRYLKIVLAIFVALFCLLYAAQNIVNLDEAYGFVAYVASMTGHEAYPGHVGPPITAAWLIWLMLVIIIALETLAGALAARGAYDLFRARSADAATFDAAKQYAIAGCTVAVIVWFGLFGAVGGAYFQMWQTEAGLNALRDASMFALQNGLALLIISQPDR